MRLEDIFKFSINSIIHRKVRSWLTILGIVIGIAAVIALVSIGQGLQQSINDQLSQLGGNTIIITPGHERAGGNALFGSGFRAGASSNLLSLTESDVRAIRTVPGVQDALGVLSHQSQVTFNKQNISSNVLGTDQNIWTFVQQLNLESGRYLSDGDITGAVVGSRVAHDLFKKNVTVNSQIVVDSKAFRVVGVLQQTGGLVGGFSDNSVIILKTTMRTVFTDIGSNDVSTIMAKSSQTADPSTVAALIELKLQGTHHVTPTTEDFTVISPETIQSSVNAISGTITIFLGGIAAISLLVGGIGVANTMFTSVIERTRQIGVLKSLGMTSREIMLLFLVESGLIGLIGGGIGAAIGVAASTLMSQLSSGGGGGGGFGFGGGGLHTFVSPELLGFAIGFSVVVGMISGALPARQAAKLAPVEALRYE